MKRRIVSIAIVAGAALLAACQVIAGIERVHKTDEVEPDPGTSSGATTEGGTKKDPCVHTAPPPPPDKADPNEIPAFYLATSKLSLVNPAENGIAGFDLDGTCTCDPRKGTAFDGGSSCTPRKGVTLKCDPDGGLDNQGSSLFNTFYTLSQKNLDDSFNAGAYAGQGNILLYIQGWNGGKDDLDISVGIFVSIGATIPPKDDTSGNYGEWTYPQSVTPIGGPTGQGTGYVSNGTLVVRNAGIVKVLLGGAGLTFNDAVIIGDLSKDATSGKAKFVGIVGGRIRDEDMLSAAGQVSTGPPNHACDDTTVFPLVKSSICAALDIAHAVQADFKGAECDAVSSAVSVTANEATLNPNGIPTPPPDPDDTNDCTPDKVSARDPNLYKCN